MPEISLHGIAGYDYFMESGSFLTASPIFSRDLTTA